MNTMSNIHSTTAKLLINGKFTESNTTEWQDILNPATQEVLGRVPMATLDEVDAAIAAAQEAFKVCSLLASGMTTTWFFAPIIDCTRLPC